LNLSKEELQMLLKRQMN
jgi:hypothetical protein